MSVMLDTHKAAEYLDLAEVTLRQWRQQGQGPPYVRMGRTIRYRVADLDRWVGQRVEVPAHDHPPADPTRQRSA